MNVQQLKHNWEHIYLRMGTRKERDLILENLSNLVAAGVSVTDSIASVEAEIESPRIKKRLAKLKESVEIGTPVYRALEKTQLFSRSVISLVRIGEETERLAENLAMLAQYSKKNREFRSKLYSAMMYPVLVLVVTVMVGLTIAWFILPKLAVVFNQMSAELPLITRIIISVGLTLQQHGAIIVPLFIAFIVIVVMVLFVLPGTKRIGQSILLRTPGFRSLLINVEIARFTYLLGTLLGAGVPLRDAFDSVARAASVSAYHQMYVYLAGQIERGHTFDQAFKSYKHSGRLIPIDARQMIITGEQSGDLPRMLLQISAVYEEKSETSTKNIGILLEPILLVVVWLAVLTVALGVIMPIYGLLNNI